MKKLWLFVLVCMASASFATVHVVNVNGASFSPADVTVTEGDTIRWIKPAGGFHNVAEVSNPPFFRSGNATSSAFTYNFPVPSGTAGTYDYECEVHGAGGMTGTVTVEAGASAPGQPSNPDPSDGGTGVPTFYLLSWAAAEGADHYIVRFGTTNPPPVVNNNLEGTLYGPPLMDEGTEYFWQLTAVNDIGETDGPLWSFTTEGGGQAPDAPTYLGPMNGATNQATTGTLSWNTALGADHYIVRLGTTNPPPIVNNSFVGTSFGYAGLSAGTQYFWQIISENDFGTADGNIWSFTTAVPLPGQASNPNPADGATNVAIITNLGWTAGANAASYEVFMGTSEPLVSLGTTTNTSIDPPGNLLNSTTYQWRVNSINETGTTTGATWSFTTEAGSAVGDNPVPTAFQLGAVYPNPFNSNVRVSLNIPVESFTTARVFDITGREVSTLINGKLGAGEYRLEWNASGQSAGLYFLKCECAGITQTQKLIYMP